MNVHFMFVISANYSRVVGVLLLGMHRCGFDLLLDYCQEEDSMEDGTPVIAHPNLPLPIHPATEQPPYLSKPHLKAAKFNCCTEGAIFATWLR